MQIQTDRRRRELKVHGTYEFPVLVSHEYLSRFERRTFHWHWHTEIEWTYVLKGEICYQVNESQYLLKAGEGLFCNTNMMHTGGPVNDEDCHYVSITFHPRLLSGYPDSFLQKHYMNAMAEASALASFPLSPQIAWQEQVLEKLSAIEGLYFGDEANYDFRIYLLLMEIWLLVYEHRQESILAAPEGKNMMRLKAILSYIQTHYQEKITLDEIAAEINICTGECCRFFKKHMNQSLFEYILDYRISKSLPLLTQDKSITEIGEQCGFTSPAYFTKVFRERMGCSPREYRKKMDNKDE